MKKLVLVFLAVLSYQIQAQEGIKFQKLPYGELIAKAKKENKLVFIDAMASWCGPCKLMEKNIFPNKKVAEFYNSNFVNASFDMEKGEGVEIAKKFQVQSYPTYLFINGDGQLISKNSGYMAESPFIELGKEASAALKNFGSMKDRFDAGENDPEFLMSVMKLKANSDYDFAKQASERYFANKKEGAISQEELGQLFFFIKSYMDPNYKFFVDRKADIVKLMPENKYTEYDNFYKLQKLMNDAVDEQNKVVKEEYFMTNATPLVGKEEAQKALNRLKLNFYEIQGMFPQYEKEALSFYADPSKHDSNELLKAAWNFSEKATDPESLRKAQEWAERVVMQRETPENTYILARVYQKSGKYEEAKMFAETSLRISEATNRDATIVKQLLEELNKK